MSFRGFLPLFLSAALLYGCDSPTGTAAEMTDHTGTWVGVNTGNPYWGDSIRVELTRTDTVLTGTYTVYGATSSFRPTDYSGAVSGRVRSPETRFGFTYNPYDYGCTGGSRECQLQHLSFSGTRPTATKLAGTFDDARDQWPVEFVRRE